MKKLQMLTAAGGILLALAGPALAAQRVHRGADVYGNGADAYASGALTDRSGSYYYGPRDAQGRAIGGVPSLERQATPLQFNHEQNLPNLDRPYGNPDTW
jgi:hypothetical protein